MNTKVIYSTVVLLASSCFALADTAPEGYELKNRSSFSLEQINRNPFCPIGWKKAGNNTIRSVDASAAISADDFVLSTVLLNGSLPLAVVNGKESTEGDVITIPAKGQEVRVRVLKIQDGYVILGYEGEKIKVLLRQR